MASDARIASGEMICILPVALLEDHPALKSQFLDVSRRLRIAPGWHYLLDLVWAAGELDRLSIPVRTVLDAGAGTGLMQWWLAARDIEVISVDRDARYFTRRMRAWAPIQGGDGALPTMRRCASQRIFRRDGRHVRLWMRQLPGALRDLVLGDPPTPSTGRVLVARADLRELPFIGTESVDAVVSISSLEHNSIDGLRSLVSELMRILKPGGRLIATVGASGGEDWFHEPSSGWCFTETSLRSIFTLSDDCESNFADYDRLLEQLRGCHELRDGLAPFYFRSGANGMPWGKWDPQYQSVGVVKVKAGGLRGLAGAIAGPLSD